MVKRNSEPDILTLHLEDETGDSLEKEQAYLCFRKNAFGRQERIWYAGADAQTINACS